MSCENKTLSSQKIVFEVEITGTEEDSENFQQFGDTLIQLLVQLLPLTHAQQRYMLCTKVKAVKQYKKTHADVRLPYLNGNGKLPCGVK